MMMKIAMVGKLLKRKERLKGLFKEIKSRHDEQFNYNPFKILKLWFNGIQFSV